MMNLIEEQNSESWKILKMSNRNHNKIKKWKSTLKNCNNKKNSHNGFLLSHGKASLMPFVELTCIVLGKHPYNKIYMMKWLYEIYNI